MFFSSVYLMWRFFFTIPFGCGWICVTAGIALLVLEAMGMVEAFVHFMNMNSAQRYYLPAVPRDRFPDVDVFIATYSEEPELLYKTINGCKHMEYPDKSKVHIYLCDDNRRPEMRALAEKMGVNYLDRPDNKGAKAGNLNNAMKHSSSPYVVTFDADMIPRRKFLMHTIPYFVDAEIKNEGKPEKEQIKLGFLQSPQNFYNPDLFQFNLFSEGRIPNEQDYFYRDIQVARTKSNSVIYGGSNTVLSREALEAVGGFYTEAITEDFATGILIEKKGYVSLGISEPLASGMSPTDLPNLIQQRIRWARGVIATGRKMHLYTSRDLSFSQKMNYWASVWYWYAPLKRLVYILSPVMYATFGFTIFKCTLPQVLAFWLPMYVTSSISLKLLSGNIRSTKWTGVYETIMFPYMLLPIILETFGFSLKKFKVTGKEDQSGVKQRNGVFMIPFLLLIVLSVIGIVRCFVVMFESSSMGPTVVLFWLLTNLYYMIMSVLFIDGRIPYRKTERVPLRVPCEVEIDGRIRKARTKDISEEGLAVEFDRPYYMEEGVVVPVELSWDIYHARLLAKLVFISQRGDSWNYSMVIEDYLDCYDDWLQINHDRIPPLPGTIKQDSGVFDDLRINTKKRIETPFFQKRHYPRILLELDTVWKHDGAEETVHVTDFNYAYINVPLAEGPEEAVVRLLDGVELPCRFETPGHSQNSLYEVDAADIHRILADEPLYEKLLDWLVEQNRIARLGEGEARRRRELRAKETLQEKLQGFDETALVTMGERK